MSEITEFYHEEFRVQLAADIEMLRKELKLTYKEIGKRMGLSGRKVKYMIWNKDIKITELVELAYACGLQPKLLFWEIRHET